MVYKQDQDVEMGICQRGGKVLGEETDQLCPFLLNGWESFAEEVDIPELRAWDSEVVANRLQTLNTLALVLKIVICSLQWARRVCGGGGTHVDPVPRRVEFPALEKCHSAFLVIFSEAAE